MVPGFDRAKVQFSPKPNECHRRLLGQSSFEKHLFVRANRQWLCGVYGRYRRWGSADCVS